MANSIKLRRSAVPGKVPDASISIGELCMNFADGVIYFKVIQDGVEKLFRLVGEELFGAFSSDFASISNGSSGGGDYGSVAAPVTLNLDYGELA